MSKAASFRALGIDGDDFRKAIERNLQASRVGDLRHQTNVGDGDGATEGIGTRTDHGFERIETGEHPMTIPGVDLGLVLPELTLEIAQWCQIVERVNIAGDELRHRAHFGAVDRIARQQRRLRVNLIQIFDDGERLGQQFAGVELGAWEPAFAD